MERQKLWVPVSLIGILTFGIWEQTGEIFRRPASIEKAYLLVVVLVGIFGFNEITNVRIMLVEAQRREWKRHINR